MTRIDGGDPDERLAGRPGAGRAIIRRPLNSTRPAVGSMIPSRTLKNVVLPAPLGPMRLTIDPSGIVKSTSFTATRPPNRRVTFVGDEDGRLPGRLAHRPPSSVDFGKGQLVLAGLGDLRVELALPPTVREEALRSQQHHRHEREAVEQELELDEVDVLEDRDAERVEELVERLEEHVVDRVDHERSHGDAPEVAHAAEDDHREDRERDDERELVRAHDGQLRRR